MATNRRRRRRGFTLMEVLLVLAILVILGSLVTVSFIRIQQNSNNQAALIQIKSFDSMIEHFMLAIGTPPTTEQGLEALRNAPSDLKNPAKYTGPYLTKPVPKDPWGGDYQYELIDANLGTYRIWSNGPDGNSGSEDDISNDPPQT